MSEGHGIMDLTRIHSSWPEDVQQSLRLSSDNKLQIRDAFSFVLIDRRLTPPPSAPETPSGSWPSLQACTTRAVFPDPLLPAAVL